MHLSVIIFIYCSKLYKGEFVMAKKKKTTKEEEIKKEEHKELVKVKTPEKPTLLEQAEMKQKKNLFIIINVVIILILIGIFSIIFAFMNVTRNVIINGVSIKGIEVSSLTMQQAKSKIEEALGIELNVPIKLQTNEYETTLNTNQIEFN